MKLIAAVILVLLAGVSAAYAQPVPPGSLVKWDYPTVEPVAVDRFEIQFDAQPFVTAGKMAANDAQTSANHTSYAFAIPAMAPGAHTVAVRACTLTACGLPTAPLNFSLVVIGTPVNLRLGGPPDVDE